MTSTLNCRIPCAPLLLVGLVTSLTVACGPSLRSRPTTVQAFRSTQNCSQGPFVIDIPASGARWGEKIVIKAWSRRVIQGRFDVTVGDRVVSMGRFGQRYFRYGRAPEQNSVAQWRLHSAKAPDNRRCVASAGGQPAPTPSTTGSTTTDGGAGVAKPAGAPPATKGAPPPPGKVILFTLLTKTEHQDHLRNRKSQLRYDLLNLSLGEVTVPDYPFCRPSRRNEIAKSTRIRIRLWSKTPNDLEGAWFEVQRSDYVPSVSEAKFIEHLDKRQASCLKKMQRKARKRLRRQAKHRTVRKRMVCRYNVVPFDGKVYYFYRPTKRMDCGCREKSQSTRCWGAGGYRGYLARLRKDLGRRTCQIRVEVKLKGQVTYQAFVAKSCRCAHDLKDPGCWGTGGYEAFARSHKAQRQRQKRLLAEKAKRVRALRRLTFGPPPSPRAESHPPKPSRNAHWVPGYWVGIKSGPSAGKWGWIAGWWRVPKADVKRGLTTRSRKRPPPPRKGVRRPPRPAPKAVWAPGYWHWSGRGFIWVHGAWRIPPRSQLRWRPARWIRRGPFRILVPGGWTR